MVLDFYEGVELEEKYLMSRKFSSFEDYLIFLKAVGKDKNERLLTKVPNIEEELVLDYAGMGIYTTLEYLKHVRYTLANNVDHTYDDNFFKIFNYELSLETNRGNSTRDTTRKISLKYSLPYLNIVGHILTVLEYYNKGTSMDAIVCLLIDMWDKVVFKKDTGIVGTERFFVKLNSIYLSIENSLLMMDEESANSIREYYGLGKYAKNNEEVVDWKTRSSDLLENLKYFKGIISAFDTRVEFYGFKNIKRYDLRDLEDYEDFYRSFNKASEDYEELPNRLLEVSALSVLMSLTEREDVYFVLTEYSLYSVRDIIEDGFKFCDHLLSFYRSLYKDALKRVGLIVKPAEGRVITKKTSKIDGVVSPFLRLNTKTYFTNLIFNEEYCTKGSDPLSSLFIPENILKKMLKAGYDTVESAFCDVNVQNLLDATKIKPDSLDIIVRMVERLTNFKLDEEGKTFVRKEKKDE